MIPVGVHWGQRGYAEAEAAGLRFAFVHPHYFAGAASDEHAGDTQALLETDLRFVLFWEFSVRAELAAADIRFPVRLNERTQQP